MWFEIDGDPSLACQLNRQPRGGYIGEAISSVTTSENMPSIKYDQPLTGWIDYQTPGTLIDVFVNASRPGTWAAGNQLREKIGFTCSGLVTGVRFTDQTARIFDGFGGQLPHFQAWLAPQKSSSSRTQQSTQLIDQIELAETETSIEMLENGVEAKIHLRATAPLKAGDFEVRQEGYLFLAFPETISINEIILLRSKIETLFCLLIGQRLQAVSLTSLKVAENIDHSHDVTLDYQCAFDGATEARHIMERHHIRPASSLSFNQLLDQVWNLPDTWFALAETVSAVEENDGQLIDRFLRLVSQIEAFHGDICRPFDSQLIDENRTKLTNLVAQTDDQSLRDTLKSILIRTTPNWSLTSRINDLKKAFQTAGFQGDVAAPKITRLRGKIAHGKQTQLNEKELKLLVACEHYLLALARFTLLREVGLSDAEISRGFYQSVTYGIFRIPPTEST